MLFSLRQENRNKCNRNKSALSFAHHAEEPFTCLAIRKQHHFNNSKHPFRVHIGAFRHQTSKVLHRWMLFSLLFTWEEQEDFASLRRAARR